MHFAGDTLFVSDNNKEVKLMMKNILFITTISGFLQKFEMNDVELLQKTGWTVHYASNFDNPIYECDSEKLMKKGIICHNIPIQKSPLHILDNMKALNKIINIIKKNQILAIHCHNPIGGVVGRLAGKMAKNHPYVIYTAHGFHFYKGAPIGTWILFYLIERFLARYTDEIITINEEDREYAEHFRLKRNGHITQIPGIGLDTNRFIRNDGKRFRMRDELGIGKDQFFLLSVGELNENKNHEIVIRALAIINDPDIVYGICGEGPKHEDLTKLIAELELEKRVYLYGYQDQVEKFNQAADCFVFPSIREGLGMAAVEAMSCELPLIVSDNRGTREYAKDNAIVCSTRDCTDYVNAIMQLKTNKSLRLSMGQKSRKIAEQFALSKTMKMMNAVYARMDKEIFM